MKRVRSDESGFVMVVAIWMLAITLLLGLALLAIVDEQTQAAPHEQRVDASYNAAESVANATLATMGPYWPRTAGQTPMQNATACTNTSQAYGSSADGTSASANRNTSLGKALRAYINSTLGTSAGTWSVSVCQGTATDTAWSTTVASRPGYASTATADKNILWVRATTTLNGTRSSVAMRANGQSSAIGLPKDSAVVIGSFGVSDTNGLTGDFGGLLGGLLSTSRGKLINPDPTPDGTGYTSPGYISLRCGLLSAINSNNLCLTGTVAGVQHITDPLDLGSLTDDLGGLGRFKQSPTNQTLTDAQIDAYRQGAQASTDPTLGIYINQLNPNADGTLPSCIPSGSAATTVVFIDQIGSDGNSTCKITGTTSQAAILIVNKGNVVVQGSGTMIPSTASTATFSGVIYAANKQHTTTSTPTPVVSITQYGKVNGAVYVDGTGQLNVKLPKTPDVCVAGICVGALLNQVLGANQSYVAVQHKLNLVQAASNSGALYSAATSQPGTFSQLNAAAQ